MQSRATISHIHTHTNIHIHTHRLPIKRLTTAPLAPIRRREEYPSHHPGGKQDVTGLSEKPIFLVSLPSYVFPLFSFLFARRHSLSRNERRDQHMHAHTQPEFIHSHKETDAHTHSPSLNESGTGGCMCVCARGVHRGVHFLSLALFAARMREEVQSSPPAGSHTSKEGARETTCTATHTEVGIQVYNSDVLPSNHHPPPPPPLTPISTYPHCPSPACPSTPSLTQARTCSLSPLLPHPYALTR